MKRIFKFTTPFGARKILEERTLLFTPLEMLNDPYEGLWSVDEEAEWRRIILNVLRKVGYQIPQNLSAMKEAELPRIRKLIDKEFSSIRKAVAVFCASEINDNVAMWAYYADHHRGAVIGFDSGHPIFDLTGGTYPSVRKLRKVTYQSEFPVVPTIPGPTGAKDLTTGFLSKGEHWAHEKEIRMILPMEHLQRLIIEGRNCWVYSIPPEAITDVIFGVRTAAIERDFLMKLVESTPAYAHVRLYQARIRERTYSLEIRPMLRGPAGWVIPA
jgi:hypothetical protein